jgi:hypothetical protein
MIGPPRPRHHLDIFVYLRHIQPMNKAEFINRLRWFETNAGRGLPDEFGHPDYAPSRGETMLAGLFARWLDDPIVPDESPGLNWIRDLGKYLVEAYAEFATHPRWSSARVAYELETSYPIPDLVDVHAGGRHRGLVANGVCQLMPLLAGAPWLRGMLESTFNAQMAVIDHAWRRFVQIAYRNLMPRIKGEIHRSNSGSFGSTTLMTWAWAGRVAFTFERESGSMTYIADDSDMFGVRSGPNYPGAPYIECVAMIEEVIAHWDADKMRPDDVVAPG